MGAGSIRLRAGCTQQLEPHPDVALGASRELLALEQGSFMVGAVVIVHYQIEPRLRNVLCGLEDALSHVPLTFRGTEDIVASF